MQFRVFLDASVLIAAAASPDGGSSTLLKVCAARGVPVLVTRLVLREAERNLRLKLDETSLLRFYELIAEVDPELVLPATREELDKAADVVATKDAHVLAGARRSGATHLATLDRRHFLQEGQRAGILPIIACTPGELIGDI